MYGDVVAVRFDNRKVVFMEQRCAGTMALWVDPFVPQYPPRQRAASFTIHQALDKMKVAMGSAGH